MKKTAIILLCLILTASVLLCSCDESVDITENGGESGSDVVVFPGMNGEMPERPGDFPGMNGGMPGGMPGGDIGSFEDVDSSLGELDVPVDDYYDGYFEEDVADISVTCVEGSGGCYTLEGGTLSFTALSADSVYSVSGKLRGNIVIDIGDEYKLDLELCGLSLVSSETMPIYIVSGDKVTLTAKKDYESFIYDTREAVAEDDEMQFSGAIYSLVDLELAGKGALSIVSENNNGVHSKKDLEVKNLSLSVAAVDNALKGNDSVTLESGTTELISRQGDGIKTTNSDISSKGNQRGTVSVLGGTHVIGAACDGIDAAYDVIVDGEETSLSIFTDKYSSASEEVTDTADGVYYLRYGSDKYSFAVKYYNSDDDYLWVEVSDECERVSSGGGGRKRPGSSSSSETYYYYSFAKNASYEDIAVYIYEKGAARDENAEYLAASSYKTLNQNYDTVALVYSGGELSLSWTNYATAQGPGGFGGGGGGNSNKGEYSTKGIKAANEISILAGVINIRSFDDSIHSNSGSELENGESATGAVNISGGKLTLHSNDDGIHADGKLTVSGGSVTVEYSYEGLEGDTLELVGGNISIVSSDDGVNSTAREGTGIRIDACTLYIYARGDGLDSNSRSSYSGIIFDGGTVVIIANSNGNSSIDTEKGYAYNGGVVVAISSRGGMSGEATHCANFSSIASQTSMSLSQGSTLKINANGSELSVVMPCSLSANVIVLGDTSPVITAE